MNRMDCNGLVSFKGLEKDTASGKFSRSFTFKLAGLTHVDARRTEPDAQFSVKQRKLEMPGQEREARDAVA